MNSTGTISLGGLTLGQSAELELAESGTQQIGMNDDNLRQLACDPAGTTVRMSDLYGKTHGFAFRYLVIGGGGGGGGGLGSGGGAGGFRTGSLAVPLNSPNLTIAVGCGGSGGSGDTRGGSGGFSSISSGTAGTVSVRYLLVAGGGGGGRAQSKVGGGGGGAGGVIDNAPATLDLQQSYTVTVGLGGGSSTPGQPSVISGPGIGTVTAIGGGG